MTNSTRSARTTRTLPVNRLSNDDRNAFASLMQDARLNKALDQMICQNKTLDQMIEKVWSDVCDAYTPDGTLYTKAAVALFVNAYAG